MSGDLVGMYPEYKPLKGKVSSELYTGFRRLGHDSSALIVDILYKQGPMKFGSLKEITVLSENQLNHALDNLEVAHLVLKTGSPRTYAYQLTKFGALLHETAIKVNEAKKLMPIDEPFSR